jgi:archaemetzincin
MNIIEFVEVGRIPSDLFRRLADATAQIVGAHYMIREQPLDPFFALLENRGQFNSTDIVTRLRDLKSSNSMRIVGITDVDICIPILTFVFGEAQLGCCAAVVSLHRLHQDFYGLPPDPDLLFRRAVQETLHELGHTFGLHHCPDYACVMHSSTTVDDIDLKGDDYCVSCRATVEKCKDRAQQAASS